MKVLVCGSRAWSRHDVIRARLARLPRGTTILHGGARGADQMAGTAALSLGFNVVEYPAEWKRFGRSAGYRRNLAMLEEHPDLVIAFQKDNSTGTEHTITEAMRRKIPLEVIADTTTSRRSEMSHTEGG